MPKTPRHCALADKSKNHYILHEFMWIVKIFFVNLLLNLFICIDTALVLRYNAAENKKAGVLIFRLRAGFA